MHGAYLQKAYLAVFELGTMIASLMIVNVITLHVEMSSAFALVFQMVAVFVPVEVTASEAWGRGTLLCAGFAGLFFFFFENGCLRFCRRCCVGL
jgi:hypothetical protein